MRKMNNPVKDVFRLFIMSMTTVILVGLALYLSPFMLLGGGARGVAPTVMGLFILAGLSALGMAIFIARLFIRYGGEDKPKRKGPKPPRVDDDVPSGDFDADAAFARYQAKQQAAASGADAPPPTPDYAPPTPRPPGFGRRVAQ